MKWPPERVVVPPYQPSSTMAGVVSDSLRVSTTAAPGDDHPVVDVTRKPSVISFWVTWFMKVPAEANMFWNVFWSAGKLLGSRDIGAGGVGISFICCTTWPYIRHARSHSLSSIVIWRA